MTVSLPIWIIECRRLAVAAVMLLPLTGCVSVYQEPKPPEPSAKIVFNRDFSTPDARGIILPAFMDGLGVSYPPFKGPHMLVTPGPHQVGLMFAGSFRATNGLIGTLIAPNQARATVEARLEAGRVYVPRARTEYQKMWLWLEEKDSGQRVSPEVPGELRREEPVRFYFSI